MSIISRWTHKLSLCKSTSLHHKSRVRSRPSLFAHHVYSQHAITTPTCLFYSTECNTSARTLHDIFLPPTFLRHSLTMSTSIADDAPMPDIDVYTTDPDLAAHKAEIATLTAKNVELEDVNVALALEIDAYAESNEEDQNKAAL